MVRLNLQWYLDFLVPVKLAGIDWKKSLPEKYLAVKMDKSHLL